MLLSVPIALSGAVALVVSATAANAAAAVDLGTASTYGVLGASTVTNTGPTVINGDLGLSPGTAVTGAPTVTGSMHVKDAAASKAQDDTTSAFNAAGLLPVTSAISAGLGGGQTLGAGVYAHTSGLGLSGALILDGANDPAAVFVFRAGSTLTTAAGSVVSLIRGANPCNVFWQVGSSATLGSNSVFVGTIAALANITADSGARVDGRLLARTEAVNLNANTITVPVCTAAPAPAASATPTATIVIAPAPAASATPTPSATPSASPVASPSPSVSPSAAATPAATASASPAPRPASPPAAVAAPRTAPVVVVGGDSAAPPVGSTSIAAPQPQPAPAPEAPAVPELPQTGAPLDAAGPAGLLMLLLGGFALRAGRRPRRGAHPLT